MQLVRIPIDPCMCELAPGAVMEEWSSLALVAWPGCMVVTIPAAVIATLLTPYVWRCFWINSVPWVG
eukprot:1250101-Prorocentrum_lima.AAC.1